MVGDMHPGVGYFIGQDWTFLILRLSLYYEQCVNGRAVIPVLYCEVFCHVMCPFCLRWDPIKDWLAFVCCKNIDVTRVVGHPLS